MGEVERARRAGDDASTIQRGEVISHTCMRVSLCDFWNVARDEKQDKIISGQILFRRCGTLCRLGTLAAPLLRQCQCDSELAAWRAARGLAVFVSS